MSFILLCLTKDGGFLKGVIGHGGGLRQTLMDLQAHFKDGMIARRARCPLLNGDKKVLGFI